MKRRDVTPPGRESQIQALKEKPGVENPWAVAWASDHKEGDCVDGEGNMLDPGEHADVIRQRGGKWVLLSKKAGKGLGTHPSKAPAQAQERTVQAPKHPPGGQPL